MNSQKILKYVECSGSPREMGRQYGEQAREEIQQVLGSQCSHSDEDALKKFAGLAEQVLQNFVPEVLKEARGLAEGAGVDLRKLLFLNQVDTLGDNAERCTPVILRETPEGTIIAKNNDAPVQEDYPFIIRKCRPEKGLPFIQVTYAGWLSGLDMMNANGLANTHGSVGSVFDKSGMHLDIRLYTYYLMRICNTTKEFLQKLNKIQLTGKGFNIAVGDKLHETVMIDAAVPFLAIRTRNKQFDYSTNIYKSPGFINADMRPPGKRDICVYRYGYLRWLEQTNSPGSLQDMKKLLKSHEPWAPCRHGGQHGSETLWSMICITEKRKMLVSHGSPCKNEYKEYYVN